MISIPVAKLCDQCIVYGIEALPITFRKAKTNEILNGLRNTLFINKALIADDEIKNVSFSNVEGHIGSSKLDENGEQVVKAATLDSVVKEYGIENVVAMKIDIEGMEELGLRGGLQWLEIESNRPCVIIMEDDGKNEPDNEGAERRDRGTEKSG